MGVSVYVFQETQRLPLHDETCPGEKDVDLCHESGHVRAFAYKGFEQSMRGLEPLEVRTLWGGTEMIDAGWLQTDGKREIVSENSYSGYNYWRSLLAEAALGVTPEAVWADLDAYRDRPFFEVINFADNEGVIGPLALADLAADFAEHREAFVRAAGLNPVNAEFEVRHYDRWAEVCRDAGPTTIFEYR